MIGHTRLTRVLLWLFSVLVAVWLVAPTLVVIPLSFTDKASLVFPPSGYSLRWYESFFTNPSWTAALTNSLLVALLVVVVSTVAGVMASLGLFRLVSRRAATVLTLGMLAPMVVPVIITAIGIYSIFLRMGILGTLTGFVLAHSVLAVPFVIISVTASLAVFDTRLEQAAASLGAGPLVTFFRVTLPNIVPGLVSGALFAFVTSFDEVVLSLFVKSPYLETLPVRMYASVTRDTDPTLAAAATVILVITTLLVIIGLLVIGRKNRAQRFA
ncbi:ABC transporter permease [Lysinibacter sp. HNR]|uniref:ABC transporter permease n=1 Tax=Lysinibacter sp. HNR TaxID=3031408 RepID=UPI002434B4BB|nr:ABC transporter permease [Lysinibacter sp. HNR]WGD37024.1 ABC transporter permease [Lysinibacter sp. HNR]